jgi:hypothetical protein
MIEMLSISRPSPAGSRAPRERREKIVADVLGSLKKPCKAGRPDIFIGTGGEA